MPLKIIGTGMSRTGTMTMKQALGTLGFGPTDHMTEVMAHPEQLGHWKAIFAGQDVDWAEVYEGYGSQIDWAGARRERWPMARSGAAFHLTGAFEHLSDAPRERDHCRYGSLYRLTKQRTCHSIRDWRLDCAVASVHWPSLSLRPLFLVQGF